VCLREVAHGILGFLLTIGWFGRLDNFIGETLESVAVLGLVLSLGVKKANVIQEAFEFTQPRPVLLMVMRPFNHVNRIVWLSLPVVALG
jgi:hypothetical protein